MKKDRVRSNERRNHVRSRLALQRQGDWENLGEIEGANAAYQQAVTYNPNYAIADNRN
ncbi:MAG: hypothetical protein HC786_33175 [Richelia sp. CSU_2_1]|nr:hypothetical protein [Microcoleus sp. SU_5_6]NJR26605.1 hypothetical protein [Richelia sp. CSU_2_1]